MRSALAFGSLCAALGFTPALAYAEPCMPAAVLEGDAPLVDAVDERLRARGIATSAPADCPRARVTVVRRGRGIAVTVVDADGRQSERVLGDASATAALIESWVRRDLNESALAGWMPEAAAAPEAPSLVDRVEPAPAARPARSARSRVQLMGAFETAVAFEGSTWLGARGGACIRIGPTCVGASARYLTSDARSLDVLATIEVPFALHPRVDAIVGAGAGAGWFTSVRVVEDSSILDETTLGPRLEGRAAIALRITRHVAIQLGAAVGGSTSAPVETGDQGSRTNNEPTGYVRFDAGLRIGVL